jgi:hypothetical protein
MFLLLRPPEFANKKTDEIRIERPKNTPTCSFAAQAAAAAIMLSLNNTNQPREEASMHHLMRGDKASVLRVDFGVSVCSMVLDHLVHKMGFLTTNDAKLDLKTMGTNKPAVAKCQLVAKKALADATDMEEKKVAIQEDENDVESTTEDDDILEEAKEKATRVIRSNTLQIM